MNRHSLSIAIAFLPLLFAACASARVPEPVSVVSISYSDSTASDSRDRIIITGLVVDEDGRPVVGATVKLADPSYGTKCRSDGSFMLDVPACHSAYEMTVSSVGMQPLKCSMEAAAGTVARLRVVLATRSLLHGYVISTCPWPDRSANLGTVRRITFYDY